MRIDSGAVAMAADRTYVNLEKTDVVTRRLSTANGGSEAETQELSSVSAEVEASEAYRVTLNSTGAQLKAQIQDNRLSRLHDKLAGDGAELSRLSEEQELSLVEQILNALDIAEGRKPRFKALHKAAAASLSGLRSFAAKMEGLSIKMAGAARAHTGTAEQAAYSISISRTRIESEATSFTAQGVARTADGREIAFNVDIAMTRKFMERTNVFSGQLTESGRVIVDPLVISLDGNAASVRDQKFVFDINADGAADEISRLGSGSGFLALDKNGDGTINDGSELFGARTGDGFAELAEYDEDGNGWIDEGDSVFNDLKVWTQDADGTDRLVAIGQADVGAIYLGSEGTEFSLTNAANTGTNAIIRKSGVYLKESGGASVIQHVDFVL